MTEMPEKLSCEKSDRRENASCLESQRFVIARPTIVPTAPSRSIGIRANSVSHTFILAILTIERIPRSSASQAMSIPPPKQSCIVSRSFVKSDMSPPTLFSL